MPDFLFQRGDVPVGWCEAKDVDKDVIKLKGHPRQRGEARGLGGGGLARGFGAGEVGLSRRGGRLIDARCGR